ncbi:MAG: YhgE/Pip domain-containing protein [Coriobacteriia bacterium]|nr:YhgE/Pip domain-containing protein [Coriobacteriia bacterium]
MTSLHIAHTEWERVTSSRLFRIGIAVIVLIPLLYGALYLWAFWDPYGNLDQIPVAIVNLDEPQEIDGTTLSAGKDLTDELLDSDTLGWVTTSSDEAAAGLEDGTYSAALTIPADFSTDLGTADSDSPHAAHLDVQEREYASMIGSQVEDRVFTEVRTTLAESTTRAYLDTMLIGFSDLHGSLAEASLGADDLAAGIAEAADGASQVAEGATSALQGSTKLSGALDQLADGAVLASTGGARLAAGASTLDSGLASADAGAQSLAGANQQIADGASKLFSSTGELAAGASALDSGLASADAGAQSLAGANQQIADGTSKLSSGIDQLAAGGAQAMAGASATEGFLSAYATEHPEALADVNFATALAAAKQTRAGISTLAENLDSAKASAQSLADGASQAALGSSSLADGIADAHKGSASLVSGAQELADGTGTLADGASQAALGSSSLADGITYAHEGSTSLVSGAQDLADGTGTLADGTVLAASGAQSLTTGLDTLNDGAESLAEGLVPAVSGSRELADGISEGASEVPDMTDAEREANAEMMASPVELDSVAIGEIPNYGTGFSPYFIPLALWVGALIAYFLLAPLPEKGVREGRSPIATALGGYWPAATIGVAQALVLVFVLRTALGLDAAAVPELYLFTILIALAFVAVLQWVNAMFGVPGKLFAIIILMLQLTSSAGTFPIEMLPGFFRTINPYLPMTYAVDGLRHAISSGNMTALAHDAWILGAFSVGALLLTSVTAIMARGWDSARLRPALEL